MKLNWHEKIMRAPEDGAGSGESQGTTAPAGEAAPAASSPDFSWLPTDYVKDGQPDFTAFSQHYSELAADAARRAEQPQPPEAYDFALPEGLTFDGLPADYKIDLATDDPDFAPIFTELGNFARDNGMPQESVSGLMGLLARYEAAKTAKALNAYTADVETLGPTPAARTARIERVKNTIQTALPEKQAAALMAAVNSAEGVRALEAILSKNLGPKSPAPQPATAQLDGLRGSALLKAAFSTRTA